MTSLVAAGPGECSSAVTALPCSCVQDPRRRGLLAGTLEGVSKANKALRERENYRIGRHFLDGADAKWIAARANITEADAQAAWNFCREKLSAFFAAADGEEVKLLNDDQLRERAEACVRLLLHWGEVLDNEARWSEVNTNKCSQDDAT